MHRWQILLAVTALFQCTMIATAHSAMCPPNISIVDGRAHGADKVQILGELISEEYVVTSMILAEPEEVRSSSAFKKLLDRVILEIPEGSIAVVHYSAFSLESQTNEQRRIAQFLDALSGRGVAVIVYSRAVRGDPVWFKTWALEHASSKKVWSTHLFIVGNARGVHRWDTDEDSRARVDVMARLAEAIALLCPQAAKAAQ